MGLQKTIMKINPFRIHILDESLLLLSTIFFDLLFSLKSIINIFKTFHINKFSAFIFSSKRRSYHVSMLKNAFLNIASNSNIQSGMILIRHYIDIVCFLPPHIAILLGS